MDEKIKSIFNAGVVGAGGAGFPTHIKLNTKAEYLIVNAAECEPLIHSDKYLMRKYPDKMVKALEIIASVIGAKKTVIATKNKYKEEIASLESSIKKNNSSIEIHTFNSFYPAGDEQVMIYEVTKRVVPSGGLPKDVGVVVCNVATIINICNSFDNVAVTRRVISVIGEVKTPSILDIPIGTPVIDVLKAVGADTSKKFAIINGGPMMGRIFKSDTINNEFVTKTTNSLIVLPEGHYLERRQNINFNLMIKQALSACIQCRQCTDMCPRFQLGNALHPHRVMRAIGYGGVETKEVFKDAILCCECGVCDYVCPMHLSPRRVNQHVKRTLMSKGVKHAPALRNVNEMREYRKLPTERLYSMIGVEQYAHQHPDNFIELKPSTVSLMLKQNVGKPAEAIVKVGDKVSVNDIIAKVSETDVGANLHASISGRVVLVDDKKIVIEGVE